MVHTRTAFGLILLLPSLAWAGDTITCDPNALVPHAVTSHAKSVDLSTVNSPTILEWDSPHSAMTEAEVTRVNQLRSAIDGLSGIPQRHWKCVDTDADTVLDSIEEMSQAEKDTLAAPALAEAAKQQAFTDEVTGNNLCTATLAEIDSAVDALIDPVTNLAEAKVALKIALKKVGRCIRARAR